MLGKCQRLNLYSGRARTFGNNNPGRRETVHENDGAWSALYLLGAPTKPKLALPMVRTFRGSITFRPLGFLAAGCLSSKRS